MNEEARLEVRRRGTEAGREKEGKRNEDSS